VSELSLSDQKGLSSWVTVNPPISFSSRAIKRVYGMLADHPGPIGFHELLTLLGGTHVVHDFPDRSDNRIRVIIWDVVV
jgi:hypothetical protein